MDWEESLFTWRCYIINIYTGLPFPCSLCLFWHTGKILKDKKKVQEKEKRRNRKGSLSFLLLYYTEWYNNTKLSYTSCCSFSQWDKLSFLRRTVGFIYFYLWLNELVFITESLPSYTQILKNWQNTKQRAWVSIIYRSQTSHKFSLKIYKCWWGEEGTNIEQTI